MSNKVQHLQMIQAVITRMAGNSFLLKGWSVTLVSALFALSAVNTDHRVAYLAFFPALTFWVLDAYFLRQERLFRKLYDDVRGIAETSVDFSMDTRDFESDVQSILKVATSNTLLVFHFTVVASIVIVLATIWTR